MNPKIFKAYDIRGKYPDEINERAVFEIAGVISSYFQKSKVKGQKSKVLIVVGHDARLSSPDLYKAVLGSLGVGMAARISNRYRQTAESMKTLNDMGGENALRLTVIPAGLITTPMFYFLVNKLKADGGIMLTASHNPKEYGGMKVVEKGAMPIGGKEILRIVNKEL